MNDVKTAIGDALREDATYLSLMGSPEGAEKETFYLQPTGPLRFPRVVFAITTTAYDAELTPQLLQSRSVARVTVWAKTNAYESIMDRIIHLLHGSEALGFHCVLTGRRQELYDQELDAYGLVADFDVFYRRARP